MHCLRFIYIKSLHLKAIAQVGVISRLNRRRPCPATNEPCPFVTLPARIKSNHSHALSRHQNINFLPRRGAKPKAQQNRRQIRRNLFPFFVYVFVLSLPASKRKVTLYRVEIVSNLRERAVRADKT